MSFNIRMAMKPEAYPPRPRLWSWPCMRQNQSEEAGRSTFSTRPKIIRSKWMRNTWCVRIIRAEGKHSFRAFDLTATSPATPRRRLTSALAPSVASLLVMAALYSKHVWKLNWAKWILCVIMRRHIPVEGGGANGSTTHFSRRAGDCAILKQK